MKLFGFVSYWKIIIFPTPVIYTHTSSPELFSERVAAENEDLRQQDHFDDAGEETVLQRYSIVATHVGKIYGKVLQVLTARRQSVRQFNTVQ